MEKDPVVAFVALSDGAIREHLTLKLSLIGCFHALHFKKFPTPPRTMFATITLTNIPLGTTKLALTVRVEEEGTGHVLCSVSSNPVTVDMKHSPDAGSFDVRKVLFDIPIRIPSISFPKPGTYSVVVLGNNEQLTARNLIIGAAVQPPQPPTEQQS